MKNRGSEWRKWNFHVHTKGTNKNDQFTSPTLDDFFLYFFKSAHDNQIEAIGITDYFSIDRYKDAVKYVSEIESKIHSVTGEKLFTNDEIDFIKKIFLFPNVALRMLPVTDKARLINIHCLFNPDYLGQLENDFFGHIENQDGKKMNRHGLIDYGRSLDPTLSSDDAKYKKGIDNFVIDLKTLKNLLANNKAFRDNCFLVVSNSNNDGASAIQKHYDLFENEEGSLDGLRTSIYKISHTIFSTNPKDIKYFLGKRLEETEGYNDQIYKKEIEEVIEKRGSLKSCIVGCDSHTESTLFNRFTWIKGELNFEGLRQICFEPEQRVKIQNTKPDFKEDKVIIDKVKFLSPSKIFKKEEICLNQNLNVIIGGKSSGKSILLYSIAKTLLPDQSILLNDNNEEKYNLKSIDSDFNFEITTGANISQKMFRGVDENSVIPDIKYIPQNYLVKLAEPELNKKGKPLNKLVRDLIKEDVESKSKYENFIKNVKQFDKDRDSLIEKYFELLDSEKMLENDLKTKSNKEVLETNISTNTKKVEELNKEAGLTPEELEKYKEVQEKQLLNQQKVNDLNADLSFTKSSLSELNQSVDNLSTIRENFLRGIKLDSIKQYYTGKLASINLLKEVLNNLIEEIKLEVKEDNQRYFVQENLFKNESSIIRTETESINAKLKPFQKNDEIQKQIAALNESIANDKKFLTEIEALNKQIAEKKVSIQKCYQVTNSKKEQLSLKKTG